MSPLVTVARYLFSKISKFLANCLPKMKPCSPNGTEEVVLQQTTRSSKECLTVGVGKTSGLKTSSTNTFSTTLVFVTWAFSEVINLPSLSTLSISSSSVPIWTIGFFKQVSCFHHSTSSFTLSSPAKKHLSINHQPTNQLINQSILYSGLQWQMCSQGHIKLNEAMSWFKAHESAKRRQKNKEIRDGCSFLDSTGGVCD